MNFLCWWKGLRGPYAALHLLDPRSMNDWKETEERCLQIVILPETQRDISLSEAMALYPCPAV